MKNVNFKILIIVLLFIWSLFVFFPGSYSVDSWTMFHQMATKNYTDWYAPTLVFVWKILYVCTGSFYSIFIFQMLLYWIFIYLLLVKVNKSNIIFGAGICLAIFFVFIPQYVMKDTHTCIAWGIASLLLTINFKGNRLSIAMAICSMLLLLYGLFIRVNAVFALLPLLYIYVESYFLRTGTVLKKAGVSVMILIAAMAANYFINYTLLDAQRTYPQYKLKLLDVIGISKATGQNYFPAGISSYRYFDKDKVFRMYTPASVDDIYAPKDGSEPMIPDPTEQLNDSLYHSWKKAIIAHPFIYLKNRGEGFLYYLRIKKRFAANEYWNVGIWIAPHNPLHLAGRDNYRVRHFEELYNKLGYTPFFDPWLWLLINVGLFIYFIFKFRQTNRAYFYKIQAFIQLSAITYLLSQFFIYQHDRDFRYNYWNVIAFFIGIICIVYKQRKDIDKEMDFCNIDKITNPY